MIYKRKAFYHETDQMGIIHHANYIKWFEEARIAMMMDLGISYKAMEERGILSPVLGIQCDYKAMVEFDDTVFIHVKIQEYNGIKFLISYNVTDESGDTLYALGSSKHCFIDKKKRIISVKKKALDIHELYLEALV